MNTPKNQAEHAPTSPTLRLAPLAIIVAGLLSNPTFAVAPNGLEFGNHAQAVGQGSIATGTNSMAYGTNAVATGNNETKETILRKLEENRSRLADIKTAEDTLTNTNKALTELKNLNAKVIEAGERVTAARAAKAKAQAFADQKQQEYTQAVNDSAQFFKDTQAKLDDFNSRLTAVNRLGNVDINSADGLTAAATSLKSIVENGTTLDNSVDWYKGYITNYYKAQGDLRKNKVELVKLDNSFGHELYTVNRGNTDDIIVPTKPKDYIGNTTIDGESFKSNNISSIVNPWSLSINSNYSDASFSKGIWSFVQYNKLSISSIAVGFKPYNGSNIGSVNDIGFVQNTSLERDVLTEEQWNSYSEKFDNYRKDISEYINKSNDPLLRSTSDKEKVISAFTSYLNALEGRYKYLYLQGKYEETHQTSYIDQRNEALKVSNEEFFKFINLQKEINTERKNIIDSYYKVLGDYKKKYITDVEQTNKITTDKLTSDLETALKINKNAVAEKQAQLDQLKRTLDQAKANADAINPTEADLQYAAQYERVKREIDEKNATLEAQQTRLNALRNALTLNDLNQGQDAFAWGTNTLVSGKKAVGLGVDNVVTGEQSLAIGSNITVTGRQSIGIGTGHTITGNNAGAFGDPNNIYGDNSYAVGNNNTIGSATTQHTVGQNTFVIGNNVTTTANNSVILGNGSTATVDNVVSVGSAGNERKIINVKNGDLSATSTDAINGSQLFTTNTNLQNLTSGNWNVLPDGAKVNIATWQNNLGTGSVSKGNTGLVTGDSVAKAIETATQGIAQSSALSGKANSDASNLTNEHVNNWVSKLNNGADINAPTGKLVTDSNVKNYVDNQVTSTVTDQYINGKLTKGNLTSSTLTVSGNAKLLDGDLSVELKDGMIGKDKLTTELANEISSKANNSDLTTVKNTAETALTNANHAQTTANDGVKKAEAAQLAANNAQKAADSANTALTGKANNDASNLTNDHVNSWVAKLNNGADINAPTGKLVTDTNVKGYVDNQVTSTITDQYINGKLTKGNLTSSTLTVSGNAKLLDGDLSVELKDGMIGKDKLTTELANEINAKANNSDLAKVKTTANNAQQAANDAMTEAKIKSSVSSKSGFITVTKKGNDYELTTNGLANQSDLEDIKNTLKTTVRYSEDGKTVNLHGNSGQGTQIQHVANGKVEENSQDAVNGGQLHTVERKADKAQATADQANSRINNLKNSSVQYNTDGDLVVLNNKNGKGTTIQNVANGEVSETSTDAVNGRQLHTVATMTDYAVARAEHNRTRIDQLEQAGIETNYRIDNLDSKVNRNRKRSDAGIAGAAAIAIIPQAAANEMGLGIGTATKNGQNAVALGVSKSSPNGKHAVKFAVSYDSQHNFIGAAGYLYKW